MLDNQLTNNNFDCAFSKECEEMNPIRSMAPELHTGEQIYMSDAGSIGLYELAII